MTVADSGCCPQVQRLLSGSGEREFAADRPWVRGERVARVAELRRHGDRRPRTLLRAHDGAQPTPRPGDHRVRAQTQGGKASRVGQWPFSIEALSEG